MRVAWFVALVTVAAVVLSPGSALHAQTTLFADSFTTSYMPCPDINTQFTQGRQSGAFAPLIWLERPETASGEYDGGTCLWHPWGDRDLDFMATGVFGVDVMKYVWAAPNHNFVESGHLVIEYDVDPIGYNGQGDDTDSFSAVIIGTDVPGTYVSPWTGNYGAAVSPNGGTGFTLTDAGTWTVYGDGGQIATGAVAVPKPGWEIKYHVKVTIDTAGYGGGADAALAFFVDGQQVYSFTRTGGFANNYITLAALGTGVDYYQTCYFDNFSVTATDNPKPYSYATPVGGTYTTSTPVTLKCSEPGTIYYTTDGSEPTTGSSVYSAPLQIGATTTLRFFAVAADGGIESPKKQEVYTLVPGTLLFKDAFTTTYMPVANINSQLLEGRQSGMLSPVSWIERPESAGGSYDGGTYLWHPWGDRDLDLLASGQFGTDVAKYVWAATTHNFIESTDLAIEFDVDPIGYNGIGDDADHFAAVVFGTDVPGTYVTPLTGTYSTAVSDSGGMAFTLTDAGTWSVYSDGARIATGGVPVPNPGWEKRYHVMVRMQTPSFGAGADAELQFYVDGSEVYSCTRTGGFANNYITLAALGIRAASYQPSFFDNFAVTAFDDPRPVTKAIPAGGEYNCPIMVELKCSKANSTIYYTLDGSEPTTSSNVYTGMIAVNNNTNLRYYAVDSGGLAEAPKKQDHYEIPSGTVVFRDEFYTTFMPVYDINAQLTEGRQTGALSPISWTERVAANDLTLIWHPYGDRDLDFMCHGTAFGEEGQYVWAAPNHNFTEYSKLAIECDVEPLGYPGTGDEMDHFAAIVFGTSVPGTYVTPNVSAYGTATSTDGMAFSICDSGLWKIYDANAVIASGSVATLRPGWNPSWSKYYRVRITIDAPSVGADAVVKFYVGGELLYTYTKVGGFLNNYVTLAGWSVRGVYQPAFFDNFSIATQVDIAPPYTQAWPNGGVYAEPVDVTLTANEPATIYYTTDGSQPTTDSPVYTGPVQISGSQTLRYFAVDTGGNAESPAKQDIYTITPAIFVDNFNTSAGPARYDINTEYNAGVRQGGTSAPVAWTERAETASGAEDGATMIDHPWGGRELQLLGTGEWGGDARAYVWASPNHDFTETGKMVIEVDMDPLAGGSINGVHRAALSFGTSVPGTYWNTIIGMFSTATSSGVGFTLEADGRWNVCDEYEDSGYVPAHSGYYHVKIEIDSAGFNGSPAVVKFYVDGALVWTLDRPAGFLHNYITLAAETAATAGYQNAFFDNLVVRAKHVPIAKLDDLDDLPVGSGVSVTGKSLYMKNSSFGYIEEMDRTGGVRIEGDITPGVDRLVNVDGTVQVTAGGERYIQIENIADAGSGAVAPLGSSNKGLKDSHLDGLYVTVWGSVKAGSVTANSFILSDGADADGIKVITQGAPGVTAGSYLSVVGAAGYDGGRVVYEE